MSELREGWTFIAISPQVRSAYRSRHWDDRWGHADSLGSVFNDVVLGVGTRVWHHLVTLGMGVAAGVSVLSALQRRLDKERAFIAAVFGAGSCLLLPSRPPTPIGTFREFSDGYLCWFRLCVGLHLLHEHVEEQLRGRVLVPCTHWFASACCSQSPLEDFYLTDLIGYSVCCSITSCGLDRGLWLPGVRGALWLASSFMLLASVSRGFRCAH